MLGDERPPALVTRVRPRHSLEERLLQLLGDRSALAIANLAVVDLADRRQLGGRAGQEDFVGDVEVVAGERGLDDFEAPVAGDLDDRMARDAVEDAVEWRRSDLAVADDEDVLARAFGDEARVSSMIASS